MKITFQKKYLLILGLLLTILSNLAQTGSLLAEYQSAQISHAQAAPILAPETILTTPIPERIMVSALIGLASVLVAGIISLLVYRRLKHVEHASDSVTEAAKQVSADKSPSKTAGADRQIKDARASRKFSILIADDNSINRLLLVNQLQNHCEQIIVAKDGIEALQHLKNKRFNLVFLDLQMPGHNGFELIETIRHTENPNKDTPIIAVTAHALPNQCKEIIAHGFDECLIKPILSEQLDEIVALWRPTSTLEALTETPEPTGYTQQILAKTAYDRDLALIILNKLCEELPQQLASIENAIHKKQWQQALSVAHKLHGSVSFCGLTDIRKLALELEQNLIAKDYPNTGRHFEKLQELIEQFVLKKNELIEQLSEKE